MRARLRFIGACAALLAMCLPGRAAASEKLADARQLYASAAYTDALAMLDGLLLIEQAPETRQPLELYRTLCLVALGRSAEALRAVEAMVASDPLYRPVDDDIPPRVRTAFTDARRRLLPQIIQETYARAKAAYDNGDFVEATVGFSQALEALTDPDIEAAAAKPPLSDLRTLAEGFRDLSAKSAPPLPQPVELPAAPPAPDRTRVFSAADADIIPPVTIRQQVPPFRGRLGPASGVVEVIIGPAGSVEASRMVVSTHHAAFDALVLSATKDWAYEPATLRGSPVRFRKLVKVNLVPAP